MDWIVVRGVCDPRLLKLVLSAAYQVSSQLTKLGIKIDLFSRQKISSQQQLHDASEQAVVQNSLLTRG